MSPTIFMRDVKDVGTRKAVRRLTQRRHLLPVLAYLALATATGISFDHASQARREIVSQQRKGCERINDLRVSIVELVGVSYRANVAAHQKGLITDDHLKRSSAFYYEAARSLRRIDCSKAYTIPEE